MNDLIPLDDFLPVVSVDQQLDVDPRMLLSASMEMRKSPYLLSYIQKLHLIALAELSRIKVHGVADSDIKAAYASARARVATIEAILSIPSLAQLHLEEEE